MILKNKTAYFIILLIISQISIQYYVFAGNCHLEEYDTTANISYEFLSEALPMITPRNLIIVPASITENSVTLVWDKPEKYGSVSKYNVYIDGILTETTDKTHYTAKNLTPDTEYSFYVTSKDNNENESPPADKVLCRTYKKKRILDITLAPYNAVGDGITDNTDSIRQAISDCGNGETVLIPEGTYLTGALDLKSNMTLIIDEGAVLQGISNDIEKYKPLVKGRMGGIEGWSFKSLINAGTMNHNDGCNCENITIRGKGTIRGGGTPLRNLMETSVNDGSVSSSSLITLNNCKNVNLSEVTLENPPNWTVHMIYCDTITTHGVYFNTKGVQNGDGWNPNSSTNCMIFDCIFNTGDDCIAIKSGRNQEGVKIGRPSKNIKIFDCTSIGGLGLAIGSELSGGIEDVYIQDCNITGTKYGLEIKTREERGGYVKNISVKDSTFDQILIHQVSYGSNGDNNPAFEKTIFDGIKFENLKIMANSWRGSSKIPLGTSIELAGFSDSYIKNVSFKNILVGDANNIRQNINMSYCENVSFEETRQINGRTPAYAMTNCINISGTEDDDAMAKFENIIEAEDMKLSDSYTAEKNVYASGGYCVYQPNKKVMS